MTRIWLNHWFSTAYNIINLIKRGEPTFHIVGSNENSESPIQAVCDEWAREPVLKDDEYVDWALDFCARHEIDVFMPRRHMLAISAQKDAFRSRGIKVMVDDYEIVSTLNQKDQAYRLFEDKGIGIVPPYKVITSAEQFETAYRELSSKFEHVCFKFAKDEGGKSYRLIDNSKKGFSSLLKKQTTRISFSDAYAALSERTSFSPLMVMPFLSGEEISVDCLNTPSGLIAVPRVKDHSRIEHITYDDEIIQTCHDILSKLPLEQPCNIQFKRLNGIPYILEINTRMSGGTHMTCLGSGINIPNIAVNKLLGIDKPWNNKFRACSVSQVEVPVVLNAFADPSCNH